MNDQKKMPNQRDSTIVGHENTITALMSSTNTKLNNILKN